MASARQKKAAKRNLSKAATAAKKKRTIAHLPKSFCIYRLGTNELLPSLTISAIDLGFSHDFLALPISQERVVSGHPDSDPKPQPGQVGRVKERRSNLVAMISMAHSGGWGVKHE